MLRQIVNYSTNIGFHATGPGASTEIGERLPPRSRPPLAAVGDIVTLPRYGKRRFVVDEYRHSPGGGQGMSSYPPRDFWKLVELGNEDNVREILRDYWLKEDPQEVLTVVGKATKGKWADVEG